MLLLDCKYVMFEATLIADRSNRFNKERSLSRIVLYLGSLLCVTVSAVAQRCITQMFQSVHSCPLTITGAVAGKQSQN
jgi:hypothetical protein